MQRSAQLRLGCETSGAADVAACTRSVALDNQGGLSGTGAYLLAVSVGHRFSSICLEPAQGGALALSPVAGRVATAEDERNHRLGRSHGLVALDVGPDGGSAAAPGGPLVCAGTLAHEAAGLTASVPALSLCVRNTALHRKLASGRAPPAVPAGTSAAMGVREDHSRHLAECGAAFSDRYGSRKEGGRSVANDEASDAAAAATGFASGAMAGTQTGTPDRETAATRVTLNGRQFRRMLFHRPSKDVRVFIVCSPGAVVRVLLPCSFPFIFCATLAL